MFTESEVVQSVWAGADWPLSLPALQELGSASEALRSELQTNQEGGGSCSRQRVWGVVLKDVVAAES